MVDHKSGLPHITFVIRDAEGGVSYLNHQVIENAAFRQFFHVHIVLWRDQEETAKSFRDSFKNADDVQQFSFSRSGNLYLTLKKFNHLLNKWPGAIVTNDGIELEALRRFGTRSILFSIVHDFYNLKLAIENLYQIPSKQSFPEGKGELSAAWRKSARPGERKIPRCKKEIDPCFHLQADGKQRHSVISRDR